MTGIPPHIDDICKALDEQVKFLRFCWTVFDQIFDGSPRRSHLLNEVASTAFAVIGKALWTEIVMLICRLTDPATDSGQTRLSFEKLHSEIRKSGEDELAKKLRPLFKKINGRIRQQSKEYRNTRLAHLDFQFAMRGLDRVDLIHVGLVKEAIATFQDYFMTILTHYYPDRKLSFDSTISFGGDDLVAVLEDGMRFREAKKKRLLKRQREVINRRLS
jgi:hypothetical protein